MIEDYEFICSENVPGPTKEEIRCLLLCKSEVSNKDIVVDIGCGTGGITVEFAKKAKKVIAIDKNHEAIKLTSKNIQKFDLVEKVDLIENDAISSLKTIDNMDIAIIGGSGGDLDEILDIIYSKLNPNGRIIITAILLETKNQAISKLKDLDLNPKLVEVNVSRGKILERGTLMMAENPIAIISSNFNE